jgi:hypothetical protein
VVVRQGDNHNRSDDDLAIDDHRLLLDRVHTQNSGLREVDAGALA